MVLQDLEAAIALTAGLVNPLPHQRYNTHNLLDCTMRDGLAAHRHERKEGKERRRASNITEAYLCVHPKKVSTHEGCTRRDPVFAAGMRFSAQEGGRCRGAQDEGEDLDRLAETLLSRRH